MDLFSLSLVQTFVQTSGFDADIVNCLVVWGIARYWCRFYPDWDYHSSTCLEDGNKPIYMTTNGTSFILDSLKECCGRYYYWNTNGCMNVKGSGFWYANMLKIVNSSVAEGNTCRDLAKFFSVTTQQVFRKHLNLQSLAKFKECCTQSFGILKCSFVNKFQCLWTLAKHK